ncbi:hypothetical protein [Haloarcula sp. Atlit-7R]|uniref:hypothetical protein n=1 Tax=Haloarcula sp. Atlit-7R TaxID=2282125 RepID=UPI001F1D5029|nr:hypothetical protein [Haloarcula sp. Atlit-7R]
MTGAPANAIVPNTTVLSNFAQVDHIELIVDLPRLVAVPAVQTELTEGVETHRYLEHALTALEEGAIGGGTPNRAVPLGDA